MSTPLNPVDPKIALVTGSSRGIGLAIAKKLLAEGYLVILNGTNNTQLKKICEELAEKYPIVDAMSANVSDENSVAELFQKIEKKYKKLDVLINNAGISPRLNGNKPTVENTLTDHWIQTISVNLTGVFFVTRAAIPLLKKSSCGRVIQIVSQAGQMNTGFASAHYATSKAGLIGFSRVLAGELGSLGITVNCVSPGKILTEMAATYSNAAVVEQAYIDRTPLQRIGQVDDVVGAVAFLASQEASFISGAVLDVTGGFFMP